MNLQVYCSLYPTYHFASITEYIPAVCYRHDSSTVLAVDRNGAIAVNSSYGNCVNTVNIAIEFTAVFDNESPIARSEYED